MVWKYVSLNVSAGKGLAGTILLHSNSMEPYRYCYLHIYKRKKFTFYLKITYWKGKSSSKPPLFGFHVNFPGSRCIPHHWALTFLNRKEVEVAAAHPVDHWGTAVIADVPVMHHWGSVVLGVTWRKNSGSRCPWWGDIYKRQLERNLNTWELKDLYKLKGRASRGFRLFHNSLRVGFRILVLSNELNVAAGDSQKALLNEETQKIRDLSADSDYAR